MGRLNGNVAIVTGGAQGQGAAIASHFVNEGAKVVIADQLDDEGRKIAAEIVAANGAASFQHLDVTDEANWRSVVAAAISEFGKLDILVNNAGIQTEAPSETYPLEDYERIIAVNLTGALLCSQAALRHFLNRPTGSLGYGAEIARPGDEDLIAHVGVDRAGMHRIDPDAIALSGEFERRGFGEQRDAPLG